MTRSKDILNKYLNLMLEIRRREEVIIGLLSQVLTVKYQIINYEVMFFQLRKILEIIAKSPMLINEDEYRLISKKPEYDWRIRQIIQKLEETNPDFFPQPIKIVKNQGKHDEFINKKEGFLTKEELCNTYDYCNKFLHAVNPLQNENPIDFKEESKFIMSIIGKIRELLNSHLYKATHDGDFYYISMDDGKGFPNGNIFEITERKTD